MPEQSTRELLILVKGEVSPSARKAIDEAVSNADRVSEKMKMSTKETEALYEAVVNSFRSGAGAVESYAEVTRALSKQQAQAKQVEEGVVAAIAARAAALQQSSKRVTEAQKGWDSYIQTLNILKDVSKGTTAVSSEMIKRLAEIGISSSKDVQEAMKNMFVGIGAEVVDKETGKLKVSLQDLDKIVLSQLQNMPELAQVWEQYGDQLGTLSAGTNRFAKAKQLLGSILSDVAKRFGINTQKVKELGDVLNISAGKLAAFAAGFVLIRKGIGTIGDALSTMKDRAVSILSGIGDLIVGAFRAGINAAGRFADATVNAFKKITKEAITINSTLEQAKVGLTGVAGSAENAAGVLAVMRKEAVQLGRSFEQLAPAGRLLAPYAQQDIDQFRELIRLSARVNLQRPDLTLKQASRSTAEFLAGQIQTITRTFDLSKGLVNEVVNELGYTAEALDIILNKYGLTNEMLGEHANTWHAVKTTIEDTARISLADFTAPTFGMLRDELGKIAEWFRTKGPEIRTFSTTLGQDIANGFQYAAQRITGSEGLSEDKIFEVADWGVRMMASLTEGILRGINQYLIPAIQQITGALASFLKGASPPKRGLLSTVDQWFGPIVRAYLSGFDETDFQALSDITRIIKASLKTAFAMDEITREDMNQRLLEARKLTVDLVQQFKTMGQAGASALGQIGNQIGADIRLISAYLDLTSKVKAAQQALAAAQEAYAAAQKKVKAAQEALRKFELETAEIPERYKRGRRTELEERIMAAQKEAEARKEAVAASREALRAAQQQLRNFMKMVDWLEKLAEQAEAVKKDQEDAAEEVDGIDIGGPIEATDELAKMTGNIKKFYDNIRKYFRELRDEFEYIFNFINGLFGRDPMEDIPFAERKGMDVETDFPGLTEGQQVRQNIGTIAENLYKIKDAIKDIVKELGGIIDWYDSSPDWMKELLKKGAMLLAINWATGGLLTGITQTLLGAGLVAGGAGVAGWLLPITLGIGLGKALAGEDADSFLTFFTKRIPQAIETAKFYIENEGIPGIASFIIDLGKAMVDKYDQLPFIAKAFLSLLGFIPATIRASKVLITGEIDGPIINFIKDLGDKMVTAFEELPPIAKAFLWVFGFPVAAGLTLASIEFEFPDIGGALSSLRESIEGWFDTLPDGLRKFVNWAFNLDRDTVVPGDIDLDPTLREAGDTLRNANTDIEDATDTGVVQSILNPIEWLRDKLVGNSIFPDLVEDIVELFSGMVGDIATPLRRFNTVVQTYSQNAADWWRTGIMQMRDDLQIFIYKLQEAITTIQQYNQTLTNSQMQTVPSTTSTGDNQTTGGLPEEFATGSREVIQRVTAAILHPGEIVLNAAQQRNVATAITRPEQGFASGSMIGEVNIVQNLDGAKGDSEIKRLAKEGAYEGIREVADAVKSDRQTVQYE